MRILIIAPMVALSLLIGCSDPPDTKSTQDRRIDRVKKAEAKLTQPPQVRTHTLASGQLLVVEVPVSDITGFVEGQRCFVWRDTELRTASISCPQPPEVDLSP
jgi:hypothetical protein